MGLDYLNFTKRKMKSFFNFLMLIFFINKFNRKTNSSWLWGRSGNDCLEKSFWQRKAFHLMLTWKTLFLIQAALLCITSQSFLWTKLSLKPPTCLLWHVSHLSCVREPAHLTYEPHICKKEKWYTERETATQACWFLMRKLIIGLTPYW